MLQESLKYTLVAEKVCNVDRTDNMFIWNPYGSVPSTTVQTMAGTYTPAAYTSTVNTLQVTDEFIVSEHIYDFERVLLNGDIYASRRSEMEASVKRAIDKWVDIIAHYKFSLIDLEIQKWTTRAKEIISTLNDLTRKLLITEMRKSELCL
jgi:hypothetical protein